MSIIHHRTKHREKCFIVALADSEIVKILKHKMRTPWDGDGIILTWHHFIYFEAVRLLALL